MDKRARRLAVNTFDFDHAAVRLTARLQDLGGNSEDVSSGEAINSVPEDAATSLNTGVNGNRHHSNLGKVGVPTMSASTHDS